MTSLRSSVYIAPPIPVSNAKTGKPQGTWSPISCTLVYTATAAVLVDTPITIQQNEELIEWIQRIAPGRKLTYLYITHGHLDHFAGIPLVLKHFPGVVPIATNGTVEHMKQQLDPENFEQTWASRFPGQVPSPLLTSDVQVLEQDGKFYLEDHILQAIECGHSDTYNSTALWVDDLKLAVCGDVVYGQVHQMLAEANTKAKRAEWIHAVETIEALGPMYVVPGHRQAEEIDGVWHLANTKKYIEDFGDVLKGDPATPKDIVNEMSSRYPDRFNPGALVMSAMGAFRVDREARI